MGLSRKDAANLREDDAAPMRITASSETLMKGALLRAAGVISALACTTGAAVFAGWLGYHYPPF